MSRSGTSRWPPASPFSPRPALTPRPPSNWSRAIYTANVLTYGMGYNNQRYSPLKQINTANVKKLVPVWTYSLNDAEPGVAADRPRRA